MTIKPNYYSKKVLELLNDRIFNLSVETLESIYIKFEEKKYEFIKLDDINSYYKNHIEGNEISKKQFDIPYFLNYKKKNTKQTLIVLGLDAKGQHEDDRVLLSTHYDYHNSKPKTYSEIIEELRNEFNIYLTDIYKSYWLNYKTPSNKSNKYVNEEFHKEILEQEINILGNELKGIVTFGDTPRKEILRMYKPKTKKIKITEENFTPYLLDEKKTKLLPIVHPSNAGNGAKNLFARNNNLSGWYSSIIAKKIIESIY